MSKIPKGSYLPFRKVWGEQRGITGLETAIVLIAFIVVAAVFAFAVLTTGLFSTEKTKETAQAGLGEVRASLSTTGSVVLDTSSGQVDTIKFKVTNAAGAATVGLATGDTLVTYSDADNRQIAKHQSAAGAGEVWWSYEWLLSGSSPNVEPGEIVEFTIHLQDIPTSADGLTTPLTGDVNFRIEVKPPEGANVVMERKTSRELTPIMVLD